MDNETKLGEKLKRIYILYDDYDSLHAVYYALRTIYGNGNYMRCSIDQFDRFLPTILESVNDHLRHLNETTRCNEWFEIHEHPEMVKFLAYLKK